LRHQYEDVTSKGLKYQYTIEGFPQAPLNGRRFMIVRVKEHEVRVDLGDCAEYFESRAARRKCMRLGKLPPEVNTKVKDLIAQAVDSLPL